MSTSPAAPLPVDREQATDRVVIDLLVARPTRCAPVQHALEEIDDAVALLARELSARGTTAQVRVMSRTDPADLGAPRVEPALEVRVNGVPINPHGLQDCDDDPTVCGIFEWDGATYAAPPAELLTSRVHDHLDRYDRVRSTWTDVDLTS